MIKLLVKFKKFFHSCGLSLVKQTTTQYAPISDLFLWRSSDEWETYFDLMNIRKIINPLHVDSCPEAATLIFFSRFGKCLGQVLLDLPKIGPRLVNISELAKEYTSDEAGTFAVFHAAPSRALAEALKSNITDRGYVSYKFKGCALRRYVHGNLDAVALVEGGGVEYLMSSSFLKKEYRLQVLMEKNKRYQLALVNASTTLKKFRVDAFDFLLQKTFLVKKFEVQSGGFELIDFCPKSNQYLTITSELIMARPLVFEYHTEDYVDLYHG